MATTIQEVMSPDPVAMESGCTAVEAAQAMRDRGIGDVIVVEGGRLIGMVTDRDITVRGVAAGRNPGEIRLSEICSGDVQTLSPGDPVDKAVKIMREKAIRRLPVVDQGRPVGVVSIGDLAVEQDPGSALADISARPPNS